LLLGSLLVGCRQREAVPEPELDRPDRAGEVMHHAPGRPRRLERLAEILEQIAELQPGDRVDGGEERAAAIGLDVLALVEGLIGQGEWPPGPALQRASPIEQ